MSFTRRRFLQAGGVLGLTACTEVLASVPFSEGENQPKLTLPAGSVDCHMHLYDNRVPPVPEATLFPPNASLEDYRGLQNRLGIGRMVIVTPSTYGTNNSVMLDGLLQSQGNARGVAVVDASVTDAALASMHKAGVRGIRFNLSVGNTALDDLERLAPRVNELRWNVQVAPGPLLPQITPRLLRLTAPVVIDHMGHVPQPDGLSSDAFRALSTLIDTGRAWVKLSAPYLRSKVGAPTYSDVGTVAQALVQRAPQRMLWGSDWPHPTLPMEQKPDDALILDLLANWAPEEKIRAQILHDNPVALYGF
ncbi:amidohydrolase family protein [Pseudomonas sp. DC3000-4b1]|uniref:amidohydrolase family protein n=1 Tax=unclassified Pseudomonas TaxID=196821 RepID=UPI003CE8E28D